MIMYRYWYMLFIYCRIKYILFVLYVRLIFIYKFINKYIIVFGVNICNNECENYM